MEIKIFKIKDTATGLFSKGGCSPQFSKKGKTWNQINHVKAHLRQLCHYKILKLGTAPRYYDTVRDYNTFVNDIPKTWLVIEIVAADDKMEQKEYSAHDLYPNEFPSR